MIRIPLRLLRRSIAAQVIVPTILLLLLAGILAVRVQRLDEARPVTVETTYDAVLVKLFENMSDGAVDMRGFLSTDLLRRVIARNPDFGYYVVIGDHTYRNMPPGGRMAQMIRHGALFHDPADGTIFCQTTTLNVNPSRGAGGGFMAHYDCGKGSRYIEFRNLRRPIDPGPGGFNASLIGDLVDMLTGYFPSVLAALVLSALIGLLILRAFRRIAQAARDFDFEAGRLRIPARTLPLEVRPLIQVIDELGSRLRDTYLRQRLFLAAAAHELRTPLAILRVRLENLDASPERDALRTEVRALSNITSQLLELMGINRRDEDRHDFELVATVEDALLDARDEYPAHRFRLLRERGDADWLVTAGNAELFRVAILNLLRNAASLSPPDAPVTVAIDASGSVTVKDAGPGIAPDVIGHVFEPFVKHPANRTGSGLGLAIVHEIIAFHRATITATNGARGGARFAIDLSATLRPIPPD